MNGKHKGPFRLSREAWPKRDDDDCPDDPRDDEAVLDDEICAGFGEPIYNYGEDLLAMGTYIGPPQEVFVVEIHYRARQASEDFRVLVWKLEVCSSSLDEAKTMARNDFRLLEGLSDDRTKREIIAIEIAVKKAEGESDGLP